MGAVTSYTFNTVGANHTISASFAIDTYTITASAGSNGAISPSGATVVNCGANQSFTISPAPCYHVADVLVDGSSVGAVTSYTLNSVDANHTISASFAIDTYTITASAGSNGSISSPGATVVNCGASQSYTITPNSCYHIVDVLVDGSSVGAVSSYTFNTVGANHTISASFAIDTYTLTASAGPNGSLAVGCHGRELRRQPELLDLAGALLPHRGRAGRRRRRWARSSSYTFNSVGANHTIAASFAIDTYPITASAEAHGAISPSGVTAVDCGAGQSYTITPDPCWRVDDVLVDGASVGAVTSYSFTSVAAAHTIHASFTLQTVTITASAGTQRLDLTRGRGAHPVRRRPGVHDHAGSLLPRRGRAGRRRLGGPGDRLRALPT